jgi:single-strand DNA-binding protein
MALPQLTATGNLTGDPELRFTPAGKAVANFTVACNKKRKTEAGVWEDVASCFLNCTVWDRDAEAVAEELTRGSQVTVVGALKQRTYEDRDGNKRTAYDVDVYSVAVVVKARLADREKPASAPLDDPWATPAASTEPPF